MDGVRKNITDLHVIIYLKLFCNDIRSIQFFIDDAAADGVSVKTDQHVKERRAVQHHQFLIAVDGA